MSDSLQPHGLYSPRNSPCKNTGVGSLSLLQDDFSSSHVQIWELDHKEGWVPKNWCFWTVVLEKTLESPLGSKEIKPFDLKGNQLCIFTGRTDAEAEAPILSPPDGKCRFIRKDPDAGKDWRLEEKGTTEDKMVGWHHWLNGCEFEQAPGDGEGRGSLVCYSLWDWKELGTTERLNNSNHSLTVSISMWLDQSTVCLTYNNDIIKIPLHRGAAAAKSLQSCLTLCDPIDGRPPGSSVPGILQARIMEWADISCSNAWKWKVKMKLLGCVRLFMTPWTVAHQALPSMGFSRQEYWSGLPCPSPHRGAIQIKCNNVLKYYGMWAIILHPQYRQIIYNMAILL